MACPPDFRSNSPPELLGSFCEAPTDLVRGHLGNMYAWVEERKKEEAAKDQETEKDELVSDSLEEGLNQLEQERDEIAEVISANMKNRRKHLKMLNKLKKLLHTAEDFKESLAGATTAYQEFIEENRLEKNEFLVEAGKLIMSLGSMNQDNEDEMCCLRTRLRDVSLKSSHEDSLKNAAEEKAMLLTTAAMDKDQTVARLLGNIDELKSKAEDLRMCNERTREETIALEGSNEEEMQRLQSISDTDAETKKKLQEQLVEMETSSRRLRILAAEVESLEMKVKEFEVAEKFNSGVAEKADKEIQIVAEDLTLVKKTIQEVRQQRKEAEQKMATMPPPKKRPSAPAVRKPALPALPPPPPVVQKRTAPAPQESQPPEPKRLKTLRARKEPEVDKKVANPVARSAPKAPAALKTGKGAPKRNSRKRVRSPEESAILEASPSPQRRQREESPEPKATTTLKTGTGAPKRNSRKHVRSPEESAILEASPSPQRTPEREESPEPKAPATLKTGKGAPKRNSRKRVRSPEPSASPQGTPEREESPEWKPQKSLVAKRESVKHRAPEPKADTPEPEAKRPKRTKAPPKKAEKTTPAKKTANKIEAAEERLKERGGTVKGKTSEIKPEKEVVPKPEKKEEVVQKPKKREDFDQKPEKKIQRKNAEKPAPESQKPISKRTRSSEIKLPKAAIIKTEKKWSKIPSPIRDNIPDISVIVISDTPDPSPGPKSSTPLPPKSPVRASQKPRMSLDDY